MIDDPFSEPDDTDKTVIRPNPGGRRSPAAAPSPTPAAEPAPVAPAAAGQDAFGVPTPSAGAQAARPSGGEAEELVMTGMNRLNACASPLFSLISRIGNRAQHLDPDKLRQSVVAEVRAFENRALQAGIPAQTVKIARYALCAVLDDVVLNTPWGGQSSWGLQSMVGTFHRETVGGDRFFDLLARLEKEPANNLELLEFIYMCLSLGFEGRLRVEQGGPDKHLQIRGALARLIRAQRGPVERDLAPNWKGLDRPFRALSAWRLVWIALGVTGVILTAQYIGLSFALANRSENLTGQFSVIDAGLPAALERRAPPPPPAPPAPPVEEKLVKISKFLQPEIDEGIVKVFQKGNVLTIRLSGSGMFGSGSDALQPDFVAPVERVANALNDEPGPIIIAGHSDNVPIRSSRFPSNMHLSLARAKSVMQSMAKTLTDPSRLSAEGRADAEPIADNATAEGRAANRRIEILLVQEQG
ncbi:type VI secretion system protein TssL, long form [Defluviimonas sp. WL0024]|uniref:Type VI secretion system protein TssL, long form n=1 Tax=Albidovulum salinarum TaxID=2984153 RepID=A0ABT2X8B2_9RHOB|nr:type VI secretion system protein TssL, long form [Defluviimonas sp. WL0024]MCU9849875.1 type VI secretion system protein TssL, long form [Defluviimonas sp. WL0024]